MLEHVYERVSMARYLSKVVIATDDERIFAEARRFRAHVTLTRSDHLSGTDRVAEVASAHPESSLIVNVQGDEPLIDPSAIDAAILPMVDDPDTEMATLSKRIEDPREITDPNVVKVVTDRAGLALYFSRSPIPHVRADERGGRYSSNTSACMCTSAIFCLLTPDCPWGLSRRPSVSSSCARSKTGMPYGLWKPSTNPWEWIRRPTWIGYPNYSKYR